MCRYITVIHKIMEMFGFFFFCFTIFGLRLFQMMYVVKVQRQDWKCNLLWPCSADGGNVGVEATDWEKWSRLFFWCFRFWNNSSVLHHGRYKHINYTLYKSTYINIQTTYYVYPPIYKKDAINSRSCVLQNPKLSCFSLLNFKHNDMFKKMGFGSKCYNL